MAKSFKKIVILIVIFFIYIEHKNYKIFNKIKYELYHIIKKRIKFIDSLYIIGSLNFGNFIICLNNAIILCEFFHCKRIIIQSNEKIFINNTIFYQKYNLTIGPNHSFIHNYNSLEINLILNI